MNTQNFKENGNQKFPLTTEALDFIQEQIKLVYGLTSLAGQFIIICEPTSGKDGLVIVDGELLPLKGTKSATSRIIVSQVDERVVLGDGSFEGIVRSKRIAMYSIPLKGAVNKGDVGDMTITPRAAVAGTEYALSKFTVLKDMKTLMSELDEAKKHYTPTGAILMWSGTISTIPTGWALCNGQTVNGIQTPNLSGRFIVGYGSITLDGKTTTYAIGDQNGKNEVTLLSNQIPSHTHSASCSTDGSHQHASGVYTIRGASGSGHTANGSYGEDTPITTGKTGAHSHSITIGNTGGSQSHENRPPYYALAYIMKVI